MKGEDEEEKEDIHIIHKLYQADNETQKSYIHRLLFYFIFL